MWHSIIEMSSNCATLAAGWIAFGGAIIGGSFTAVGVWWALRHSENVRRDERKRLLLALYQSLYTEIKCVFETFEDQWGQYITNLKDENEYVNCHYATNSDYFIVYRNNCGSIGHIPDEKLRRHIIGVYIGFNGMIDGIRHNNILLQDLSEMPSTASARVPQIRRLIKFTIKIKTAHLDLKEKTAIVMEELDAAVTEIVRQLS